MRVHNQSLVDVLTAERVEVLSPSDFPDMFYVRCWRGDHLSCVSNADGLLKFFTSEAAAWKWVRRYRDVDTPRLFD